MVACLVTLPSILVGSPRYLATHLNPGYYKVLIISFVSLRAGTVPLEVTSQSPGPLAGDLCDVDRIPWITVIIYQGTSVNS